MSISESERHEIYESRKNQHGERVASKLMSMLPPVGWADVATKTDVAMIHVELRALGADLRTEMHQSIRNQTWALVAWTTGWTTALAGLFAVFGR